MGSGHVEFERLKSRKIRSLTLAEKNRIILSRLDKSGFQGVENYFESELPAESFIAAGNDMLVHQALLARFFLNGGAMVSASRIARELLAVYEKRTDRLSWSGRLGLLHQISALYLELYDEQSLLRLETLRKRCTGLSSESMDLYRVIVLQCQIYSGTRSWSAAVDREFLLIRRRSDPALGAVIDYFSTQNQFLSRGTSPSEILGRLGKLDEEIPDSLRLFYRVLKAKVLIRQGRRREAHSLLRATQPGQRLDLEIEGLFLRRYLLGEELALADDVELHCYPAANEYLYLLGNRNMPDGFRLSDVFLDQLPGLRRLAANSVDADSWLIAGGKVSPRRYVDVVGERHLLDLRAGVLQAEGELQLLGRNRCLALACIISTGTRGAGEVLLAERVYESERIPISSAIERVRNLVTQLQRLGIPLIRSGRRVRYDFDTKRDRIVLPKVPTYGGQRDWFRARGGRVSREMIMEKFGVSRRAASYSLQCWRKEGMLREVTGSRGVYEFSGPRVDVDQGSVHQS